MKKMLLKIIQQLINFLQISKIRKNVIFRLKVFEMFFSQNECQKYKDCFLLQELRASQPTVSERQMEYSWVIKNINLSDGKLLDVGSTDFSFLSDLLPKTVEINAININQVKHASNKVKFIKGDIRQTNFPDKLFDYIVCVSTLEHIGVKGRYHSDNDPDGDAKAMQEITRILKPKGALLLTVPYGANDVLPINKLYNKERLSKLFKNLDIVSQVFFRYEKKWGFWREVNETEASKADMIKDKWYALAFIKAVKK